MSYANHPACMAVLAEQGFLMGGDDTLLELRRLDTPKLDEAIKAEFNVVEENQMAEFNKLGLAQDHLVGNLFPNFYSRVAVSDEDRNNPDPDLALVVKEKDSARATLEKLVWDEAGITSTGRVQQLFGLDNPPLLLVEVQVQRYTTRTDGSVSAKPVGVKVRFATRNPDIVDKYYVDARGKRFLGIAKSTSADVAMAIARIPLGGDQFRSTFGLQVDNAIQAVKPNAIARFIAKELDGGGHAPEAEAKPNGSKAKSEKVGG